MYCMRHTQNHVYYRKFRYIKHIDVLFRHFQPYYGILEPCVILVYSEPCHIQSPGIFRLQDIFRTLSRHILAYSDRCVRFYIDNPAIFRILRYLETEANSIMKGIITWTFFFPYNLKYFSTKFKKTYVFGYIDVNFNVRLSLLK